MNRRIRLLPTEVIDQIAAGEVVERPSSVVKELLENALDAGSTDIHVRAAGGGTSMIEVSDNGVGMDRDDALECTKRHATSKIQIFHDLATLRSLGFRGEALSSIAAVSRVEIVTRTRDAAEATRILVEGGRILEAGVSGSPPGTRVRVEKLFFNVPARRKFLRSQATETHHLKEVVERMAMIRSDIGFRYLYEGRRVLDSPPAEAWPERIRQILGKEAWQELHPVHVKDEAICVEGYLSHPNFHRGSSTGVWLYVNRRSVQDRGLVHALLRGYGPLLERGKFPVGVLHITIRPQDVDVNVHPTKREVRFRDPQRVAEALVAAVRGLLREQPWVPSLQAGAPDLETAGGARPCPPVGVAERSAEFASRSRTWAEASRTLFAQDPLWPSRGAAIRFIGQVGEAYLVFSGPGGLLIVDQHAAHERVLFEQIQERLRAGGGIRGQAILWDEVMEASPALAEIIEEILPTLEKLGLVLEPFGGNAWRIRAIPPWMEPGRASALLREMLEELEESGKTVKGEERQQRLLAEMACREAVKGGRSMTADEAVALLEEMRHTPSLGLCPHGRPTVLEISFAELKRRFGRS